MRHWNHVPLSDVNNQFNSGFLTAVNCYKVKTVKTVQDFFSLLKILALIAIIAIGAVWLAQGNVDNLGDAMQNTSYRWVNTYGLTFSMGEIHIIAHFPQSRTHRAGLLLRALQLRRLELPQLCHRGDQGADQEPAARHRRLHAAGDRHLPARQRGLLRRAHPD